MRDQSPYVKDPTENVQELLSLYMERADRLRDAEQLRLNELMTLQTAHAEQLREAEAKRIDAIRAVDVNAVSVANEKATSAAAVLAAQVSSSAETLRALVATTATAQAQQLTQLTTQLVDRISLLEKSQYERKGSGTGMRDLYAWLFAGVLAVINITGVVYAIFHH